MKLYGKVVGNEIVDMGKGKDAAPMEELRVTIKLDPKHGGSFRGRMQFNVPLEEAAEWPLGDVFENALNRVQQKLDLVGADRS